MQESVATFPSSRPRRKATRLPSTTRCSNGLHSTSRRAPTGRVRGHRRARGSVPTRPRARRSASLRGVRPARVRTPRPRTSSLSIPSRAREPDARPAQQRQVAPLALRLAVIGLRRSSRGVRTAARHPPSYRHRSALAEHRRESIDRQAGDQPRITPAWEPYARVAEARWVPLARSARVVQRAQLWTAARGLRLSVGREGGAEGHVVKREMLGVREGVASCPLRRTIRRAARSVAEETAAVAVGHPGSGSRHVPDPVSPHDPSRHPADAAMARARATSSASEVLHTIQRCT